MRINLRRLDGSEHPKPAFVGLNQIGLLSFVVAVRHLRLPETGKTPLPVRSKGKRSTRRPV